MKITVNKLRSIIAEEVKSKSSRGGWIVVAADGGGRRSWIVGAVDAPNAEAAKAAGGEAYADRIGGNYVDVYRLPSGVTVASVNEMVDKVEEAEELQLQLDAIKRAASTTRR